MSSVGKESVPRISLIKTDKKTLRAPYVSSLGEEGVPLITLIKMDRKNPCYSWEKNPADLSKKAKKVLPKGAAPQIGCAVTPRTIPVP